MRRSIASPARRRSRAAAGPGGQAGDGEAEWPAAPERSRRERAEGGLSPGARRLGGRPARELEQAPGVSAGTGSRTAVSSSRRSSVPGSTATTTAGRGRPRNGTRTRWPGTTRSSQLERNAIRERARNGKVEDDVREQGPASGAGGRPTSDPVVLAPDELQIVSTPGAGTPAPGFRKRNAGWNGRDHDGGAQLVELAPQPADRLPRPQDVLGERTCRACRSRRAGWRRAGRTGTGAHAAISSGSGFVPGRRALDDACRCRPRRAYSPTDSSIFVRELAARGPRTASP